VAMPIYGLLYGVKSLYNQDCSFSTYEQSG